MRHKYVFEILPRNISKFNRLKAENGKKNVIRPFFAIKFYYVGHNFKLLERIPDILFMNKMDKHLTKKTLLFPAMRLR